MQYSSFTGTVQEFIKAGVKVNNQPLDTVSFSILARYSLAKMAGIETKANPSKRGRSGIIYTLQGKPGFNVQVPVQTTPGTAKSENLQLETAP